MADQDQNKNTNAGGGDKSTNGKSTNGDGAGGENNGGQGNDDGNGAGNGDGKDTGNKDHMIPKSRFDEINQRMKAAEDKVAAQEAKERADAEAKAKANGEYETIITAKDAEISTLKAKADKITSYDETVTAVVTQQITELEQAIGKEKLDKILGVVGFESMDALQQAQSIGKIKDLASEFVTTEQKGAKGGEGMGPNGKTPSLEEAKKGGFNAYLSALVAQKKS